MARTSVTTTPAPTGSIATDMPTVWAEFAASGTESDVRIAVLAASAVLRMDVVDETEPVLVLRGPLYPSSPLSAKVTYEVTIANSPPVSTVHVRAKGPWKYRSKETMNERIGELQETVGGILRGVAPYGPPPGAPPG